MQSFTGQMPFLTPTSKKHTGLHLLCIHHNSCNTLLTAIFQDNPDKPVPECDVLIIPLGRTVLACPCPVLRPYRDWRNAQSSLDFI